MKGDRIGPYVIARRIGGGGFGVVYEARRRSEDKMDLAVALKVIKPGMDTESVVARFEHEREVIARMDHSCIARVFDAGSTDRGLPYFVMQLVRGEELNKYPGLDRMPMHERLRLFLTICGGVHHAHQKGVIHRDLKPSNILVSLEEGHPRPKIVDFGIAKAVGGVSISSADPQTEEDTFIGTPEYMPPEQAENKRLDVDVRTDVYSLGVILYQLICDELPFPTRYLRSKTTAQIRHILRHEIPDRPSKRVQKKLKKAADQRSLAQLAVMLRRDLDWIVMKCLEKDRTRRYSSVESLVLDLERFLAGEPVEARPPELSYQARKFVGRHKAGVAIAAGVGLAALVATGGTTYAVNRIESERRLKEAADREREFESVVDLAVDRFTNYIWNSKLWVDDEMATVDSMGVRDALDRVRGEISTLAEEYSGGEVELQHRIEAHATIAAGRLLVAENARLNAEPVLESGHGKMIDAYGVRSTPALHSALVLAEHALLYDRAPEAGSTILGSLPRDWERSAQPSVLEIRAVMLLAAVSARDGDRARAIELYALAEQMLRRSKSSEGTLLQEIEIERSVIAGLVDPPEAIRRTRELVDRLGSDVGVHDLRSVKAAMGLISASLAMNPRFLEEQAIHDLDDLKSRLEGVLPATDPSWIAFEISETSLDRLVAGGFVTRPLVELEDLVERTRREMGSEHGWTYRAEVELLFGCWALGEAQQDRTLALARSLAARIVETRPPLHPDVVMVLESSLAPLLRSGWFDEVVLYVKGELDRADAESISKHLERVRLLEILARAYAMSGRLSEAIQTLDRAIDHATEAEGGEAHLARLQMLRNQALAALRQQEESTTEAAAEPAG